MKASQRTQTVKALLDAHNIDSEVHTSGGLTVVQGPGRLLSWDNTEALRVLRENAPEDAAVDEYAEEGDSHVGVFWH